MVYTHGFAGLIGGLLVGILADPGMTEYMGLGKTPLDLDRWPLLHGRLAPAVGTVPGLRVDHLFFGRHDAIIFYIVKFICRGLREKDEALEIGDLAVHAEEAFPVETFAERVSSLSGRRAHGGRRSHGRRGAAAGRGHVTGTGQRSSRQPDNR